MKKHYLVFIVLFIVFLSACSLRPEAKINNNDIKQNDYNVQTEGANNLVATNSVTTTTTDLRIVYIEDLKPGYNYGTTGVTVKSVKSLVFPEDTKKEWVFDLKLNGELNVSGRYYAIESGGNPYCFEIDNPNILPQLDSKEPGFMSKYLITPIYTIKDFCFMDEQSDALAVKVFGPKFNKDKINTGQATIKIKDIAVYLTTTAEPYNSAILLEAIKD